MSTDDTKPSLYCFMDESGNFDFTNKTGATKYFVLTVLSTTEPSLIAQALVNLRYNILPTDIVGSAYEHEGYFHATKDTQAIRDKVFEALIPLRGHLRVDSVIAQKNKANPILYPEPELYIVMSNAVFRYAFNRAHASGYRRVVVVFSNLFTNKIRGKLKQTFKAFLKQEAKLPFEFYFHPTQADMCSQAADYFGWAIYRHWEDGDSRSYAPVREAKFIQSEFDIFMKGTDEYYEYKK